MRLCLFLYATLAVAAVVVALPALGAAATPPQKAEAVLGAKSVTIFPIVLSSDQPLPREMPKKAAELVGLFLERGGMQEIEITDAEFTPPPKADLAKVAETFGEFVRSQHVRTEYALCGQFIGSPGSGATEIRLVVADRQGKVVLADRLGREQIAASGEEKVDPMIASLLLVDRLREPWGLADPQRKNAPEGKTAQLWDENSGLPPKSEREAMERRLTELKGKIKTSTLAVFPVHVGGKSDPKAAATLAEMLTKKDFARAEAATADPRFQVEGNTNELRILWDTARALQDFLRKNPPDTDYVLFADYGATRSPDGKLEVHAVHFVLCDRHGDWVLVSLANSHHADFQQIHPQSVDNCNRLVLERLHSRLHQASAEE